MDANIDSTVDHNASALNHPIENEIIESWTFLCDKSKNSIQHEGSGVDNIVKHPDDDTKLPAKTSRNSSSGGGCLSDNFLSVTYHGTDGDISDGISIINDCESISDCHSPMPPKRTLPMPRIEYTDEDGRRNVSGCVDFHQSFSLVEPLTENEVEVLNSENDSHRASVWWNPTNIILFGLIIGTAAKLSSQCWKINVSHENIIPEMSLLAQRIQDLERENLVLKVEVNRLAELHHAGHDHSRTHKNRVVDKRSVKQKKVWTDADAAAMYLPKKPIKENYCADEYLNLDDLFATYNFKKCENIDDAKKQNFDDVKKQNIRN